MAKLHFNNNEVFAMMDVMKSFGATDINMSDVKTRIDEYSQCSETDEHTWGTFTKSDDGITIEVADEIAVKCINAAIAFAPYAEKVLSVFKMLKAFTPVKEQFKNELKSTWDTFTHYVRGIAADKVQHELYDFVWNDTRYMTIVRRNQYGCGKPLFVLWDSEVDHMDAKEVMTVITNYEIKPVLVEASYDKFNTLSDEDIGAASVLLHAAMKSMSCEAFAELCNRCHWTTVHEAVTSPEANMCFAKLAGMTDAK